MKGIVTHVTQQRSADLNSNLESGVFTIGQSSVDKGGDDKSESDWKYDTETGNWVNQQTGEVYASGSKDDSASSEAPTEKEAVDDGKNDWYYDEKTGQWVNKSSGE